MGKSEHDPTATDRRAWNSGRKVGAKRALKPRQVWAIRFFLDQHRRMRDRALFDLAIDSKLRGCDVVKIRIGDLVLGGQVRSRAIGIQAKTGRPVQFELMSDARASLLAWLERRGGTLGDIKRQPDSGAAAAGYEPRLGEAFPLQAELDEKLARMAGLEMDLAKTESIVGEGSSSFAAERAAAA